MKITAAGTSGKRIALFSAALVALTLIGLLQSRPHQPIAPPANCPSVPGNVEPLGPALSAVEVQRVLAGPRGYSHEVRALLEPGVSLHEFRTGVTGGHLAVRGRCYVGQAVAWVR